MHVGSVKEIASLSHCQVLSRVTLHEHDSLTAGTGQAACAAEAAHSSRAGTSTQAGFSSQDHGTAPPLRRRSQPAFISLAFAMRNVKKEM